MTTPEQVRGMMLEEVLLYLLKTSGYKTIETIDPSDKSLCCGPAGLKVKGRGADHQIDAIAEFFVAQPFTYPQRLLIEAKCYGNNKKVGIEIIRNALGVMRDVQEYWTPTPTNIPLKARYHYQYAIFSTSKCTKEAERFGFAQDIYIIPIEKTGNMQPVIRAIELFNKHHVENRMNQAGFLHQLRLSLREKLINPNSHSLEALELNESNADLFGIFIDACREISSGYLALLNRRIPIFMMLSNDILKDYLIDRRIINVRIFYDEHGWYINTADTDMQLFSFQIPEEVLDLYLQSKALTPEQAINLKLEVLGEIEIVIYRRNTPHFVTLRLDIDWINQVRDRILRRRLQND